MAFRGGRGRGRGFGRGDFRFAKQESFVLFPDIELPGKIKVTEEELKLLRQGIKFRQYFKTSPYFLEETLSDSKEESVDIGRYFDGAKKSGSSQGSLISSGYLILEPGYFPTELVQGTKRKIGRKVQWNRKKDLQKLDLLEQLEEKVKGQDPTSNEGEEDEDEEENMEDDEEDSDEGDYEQGEDFDDDEDDYNMGDDGDDEAIM